MKFYRLFDGEIPNTGTWLHARIRVESASVGHFEFDLKHRQPDAITLVVAVMRRLYYSLHRMSNVEANMIE